jgi:hypothetical protein
VKRTLAIRRLLAALTIAGLALAPISRPVMAGVVVDASMQATSQEMSPSAAADEMASDMPCCPTKAPAPVDCDKCVFMAGCMTKCFASPFAALFHPFPDSGQITALQNDFWPDGFGQPPPEHPPRTLV